MKIKGVVFRRLKKADYHTKKADYHTKKANFQAKMVYSQPIKFLYFKIFFGPLLRSRWVILYIIR